jgi:arsenate reductase-like glutaredoxin family protein
VFNPKRKILWEKMFRPKEKTWLKKGKRNKKLFSDRKKSILFQKSKIKQRIIINKMRCEKNGYKKERFK